MPRVRVTVAFFLLAAASAVIVVAQTRPNLAGTWTFVPEKSVPANQNRPANTGTLKIAIDGQSVIVTRMAVPGTGAPSMEPFEVSTTYATDGEDHPTPPSTPLPAASQAPRPNIPPGSVTMTMGTTESTYRAIWTRDQLVLITRSTTATTMSGSNEQRNVQRRVTRQAYSIDAEGFLVVESVTITEPTVNGPSQPAPVPTRNVYRKGA